MKRLVIVLSTITISTILLCAGVIIYYANKKPIYHTPQIVHTVQISVPLSADTIFNLVNTERIKAGISPLMRDARLDASAQAKADDMTVNGYFNHISPITGKHGYELIPKGMCLQNGENIGLATDMAGDNNYDAVNWWMHSKPHHDAILNPKNMLTGIGVNGAVSVQHFCQQ